VGFCEKENPNVQALKTPANFFRLLKKAAFAFSRSQLIVLFMCNLSLRRHLIIELLRPIAKLFFYELQKSLGVVQIILRRWSWSASFS